MGGEAVAVIFHSCLCRLLRAFKYIFKLQNGLLVGGQCLDRLMFCLKPFDFISHLIQVRFDCNFAEGWSNIKYI